MNASRHFAQSYAEARAKFLAGAQAAGLHVQSHRHPMRGRDGEELAMDVARFGAADAPSVLLITSACHGVEGYCGSGVQNDLLADATWHEAVASAGAAVLYVHALNPYGFSWGRRTTQENVDLNRNFHDFTQPLPHNAGYAELGRAIVPAVWPSPEADAVLMAYAAKHGFVGLQAALSAGQYDDPQGIFYGGRNPTWSHRMFRQVLKDEAQRCQRLAWIDLHTGLGPSGHGERIFFCRHDEGDLQRARAWWGTEVTSAYDGSSTSALLSGMACAAIYEECPQAEYTGIALEFGTLPVIEVTNALRADQWLENHPETGDEQRVVIKRRMRDAFYTDTDGWKARIVEQAQEAARQAVVGLSAG